MNDTTKKRTISFYMPSEVKGEPRLILKELDEMFKACAAHLTQRDLDELKEAYPLAFRFVEAI